MWEIALAVGEGSDEVDEWLPTPHIDNMGRDYILYWPNIPWDEDGEDEDLES